MQFGPFLTCFCTFSVARGNKTPSQIIFLHKFTRHETHNDRMKLQPDRPNMTLLSSNTTASSSSDSSCRLLERVKEPPIRPRSAGGAGAASAAKHLRPSLTLAHLVRDQRAIITWVQHCKFWCKVRLLVVRFQQNFIMNRDES